MHCEMCHEHLWVMCCREAINCHDGLKGTTILYKTFILDSSEIYERLQFPPLCTSSPIYHSRFILCALIRIVSLRVFLRGDFAAAILQVIHINYLANDLTQPNKNCINQNMKNMSSTCNGTICTYIFRHCNEHARTCM
jgi:hypothetical protein